jgi:ERCC4-related helicase
VHAFSSCHLEHFAKKKADNQDTRAIIFSQWRDSVDSIVSMINSQNDETLKPSAFIGQNKKSGGSKKSSSREVDSRLGTELVGMNQAQQQRVLEDFKVGIYNILVCTSVAEEVSM